MRIIEWNCQGAFRKKNNRILAFKPDILVISECESIQKLEIGNLTPEPNDYFWHGDSDNKGIGIFSYSDYKFELLRSFNEKFKYIIPLKVTGKDHSFLLFAIWAMDNKENPKEKYIGQIWLAINYYSNLFSLPCILTGDFNSNKIWDEKDRVGNHSDMVQFLKMKSIHSLYHEQELIDQGKETHPTFHLYRKMDKPYHIDYFFASESITDKGYNLFIDKGENWIDLSDHVPLMLDLNSKPIIENFKDSFGYFMQNKMKEFAIATYEKFNDLIDKLGKEAKQIDTIPDSKKFTKEKRILIDKYEKLFKIDQLIRELKI